ncbi:ABC-2 type transport system permease protein [Archangium gephyra]|uniref:ABC-2 type transport system permease protein n=1 Tax=Archangium gephyra TaxID=48 RepID=A0AAC8Q7P6_9BACT|nr:ABC transporter permease [Archangium gephyra]AKJ02396.1 gliding motility protein GldF [Archangium gephyra]REG28679.1 ABC-2 type transport system permease protein [Archangium gephyra]
MRTALAIARKELSIYFTTPWAYAVFTAMLAVSSFFFVNSLYDFQRAQEMARTYGWDRIPQEFRNLTDGVMVPFWSTVVMITLFVVPFLSMRLFAEEKRNKTFELLMTAPVRPVEIVLGKYLGGLGIITTTLGLTIFFPVLLTVFGQADSGSALEWGTVLLGYGGLLLWGATCMAVGMFISSLTESQMVAALVTFAVLLPWMLLQGLAQATEEPVRSFINYLSFGAQLQGLMRGVLDLKALVFFFSVIFFSLLLSHRTVEAQRWA